MRPPSQAPSKKPPRPLTPRQEQALAAIRQHQHAHGVPPTHRDLAATLGGSLSNVDALLTALKRKGAVLIEPATHRGIRVAPRPDGLAYNGNDQTLTVRKGGLSVTFTDEHVIVTRVGEEGGELLTWDAFAARFFDDGED